MGLKDKFVSKIPEAYILHKTRDKQRARLIIKGYRAIRKYNLFDDEFYLNSYPKVRNSNMDPLLHYLYFGFKEGKRPNKTFDALFYKYNYDDVNINPLIHYALYGLAENRQIKPENNLEGYKKSNKKRIILSLLVGILYASLDEFHQSFSPGRTPKITDVYIDTLGILLGIVIILFIREIYHRYVIKKCQ